MLCGDDYKVLLPIPSLGTISTYEVFLICSKPSGIMSFCAVIGTLYIAEIITAVCKSSEDYFYDVFTVSFPAGMDRQYISR